MPEPTIEQQAESVRTFAILTERIAHVLHCPYSEAAVFLMKLGPLFTLMQDADFADKLTRYIAHVAATTAPTSEQVQ